MTPIILSTTDEVCEYLKRKKSAHSNIKIGFVPTMGALHEGHISLIRQAKLAADLVIVSIFVNPIQFNNQTDFQKYPIQIQEDIKLLESVNCDALFIPAEQVIYPNSSYKNILFDEGNIGSLLEGLHRPGHFKGVAVVVKRLFEIIQPDITFFGQKDYQQWLIINKLVLDLQLPIQLIMGKTVREPSGLAMSSRNVRLSENGKEVASKIYEFLSEARQEILLGNQNLFSIKEKLSMKLSKINEFTLEYVDICSAKRLESIKNLPTQEGILICLALFLEGVRLIDNVLVSEDEIQQLVNPS